MRKMAEDAGYMALEEVQNGRTVMILLSSCWRAAMFNMSGAPKGIFLRVSDHHSNLKSLVVDTVILVAADDDGWDQEGLEIVKEKLRVSRDPKLISVFRGSAEEILTGNEI